MPMPDARYSQKKKEKAKTNVVSTLLHARRPQLQNTKAATANRAARHPNPTLCRLAAPVKVAAAGRVPVAVPEGAPPAAAAAVVAAGGEPAPLPAPGAPGAPEPEPEPEPEDEPVPVASAGTAGTRPTAGTVAVPVGSVVTNSTWGTV